jgi:hypothetical protein
MRAEVVFLSGMATMGFLVGALFFMRFWRRTRDRLFLVFGAAFLLFAINQTLVALSDYPREDQSLFYLLRFAGFALLVGAIIAKNVGGRNSRG